MITKPGSIVPWKVIVKGAFLLYEVEGFAAFFACLKIYTINLIFYCLYCAFSAKAFFYITV